jgi:predicted PurR-regulated permease PerM
MLVIIIPFFFLLYALADQTFQFYQLIASKVVSSDVQKFIYSDNRAVAIMKALKITRGEMLQKAMEFLQSTSLMFFSNLTRMASFSLRFLINFLFMLMIMFAIFNEGHKLGDLVYHIIPFPRDIEHSILKRLREVIKVLVAGNIAIMLLQGVAIAVGFFIFGIKVPVLGGCLGALFSLIPGIGTSFVWLPAALGFILSGKYLVAILFIVWCLGWYLFLENIAKPRFFGSKLDFHPLVFFFLLIGSIGAFGLPGIIVGPIILTLFFSLWEIYSILYIETPSKAALRVPEKKKEQNQTEGDNP